MSVSLEDRARAAFEKSQEKSKYLARQQLKRLVEEILEVSVREESVYFTYHLGARGRPLVEVGDWTFSSVGGQLFLRTIGEPLCDQNTKDGIYWHLIPTLARLGSYITNGFGIQPRP